MKRLRSIRTRFYQGPADLGLDLHRSGRRYRSPTITAMVWIYAFLTRHFSIYGFMTLAFLAVALPYALLSTAMPLYRMAFAVGTMFIWDFFAGALTTPRVEIERRLPRQVRAGSQLIIQYRVSNLRQRPVYNLLVDSLPKPQQLPLLEERIQVRALPGLAARRLTLTLQANRRGRYTLPAVRAVSRYPFGLWTWGRTVGGPESVTVTPAFTPLEQVELPFGVRYQHEGPTHSNQNSGSLEFLGCRPFRDGDNPKQLHMRSWARLGYPVVKEFRQEYLCRTGVILDTYLPRLTFEEIRFRETGRPIFEAAVSLTAALVDFFGSRDSIVDLFAAGRQVYHFSGNHGAEFRNRVLEILACIRHSHRDEIPELGGALEPFLPQSSGVALVFTRWNKKRETLLEGIHAAGVRYRAILVTDAKEKTPENLPAEIIQADCRDILAGRVTLL